MDVNFDGKSQKEKVFVDEDSYPAVISGVSDIRDQPKYQKPNETEEKLNIDFKIKLPNNEQKEISFFCKPLVSKGSGDYSNSKMFDLLEKCELLDAFKEAWKTMETIEDKDNKNKEFVDFLRNNLINKPCKVMAKTVKKGTPEQYSVVEKVIKFGA